MNITNFSDKLDFMADLSFIVPDYNSLADISKLKFTSHAFRREFSRVSDRDSDRDALINASYDIFVDKWQRYADNGATCIKWLEAPLIVEWKPSDADNPLLHVRAEYLVVMPIIGGIWVRHPEYGMLCDLRDLGDVPL